MLDITTVMGHDLDDYLDTSYPFFLSSYSWFFLLSGLSVIDLHLSLALLCAFHRFSCYLLSSIPYALHDYSIVTVEDPPHPMLQLRFPVFR